MYELHSVIKNYAKKRDKVTALDNIDLVIGDGDYIAVQGRTGSGKTTLLQIIGAMDAPSSGQVFLDRDDLGSMPSDRLSDLRAHSIGFVFQAFNLLPTLSALENVEAAIVPLHLSASDRRARAESALAEVGLADRQRHLPTELSGGQQQRVGISRAIVKRPRVLLADEPTGNLDIDTRDEIMTLIEHLWSEQRLTLVLITHDPAIAARAKRVVVLEDGRLVSDSKTDGISDALKGASHEPSTN